MNIEIERIYNLIKTIKKMPGSKVSNNNLVVDTIHGIDISYIADYLNSKKLKTVMVPCTKEYETRLKDSGREYLDLYKLFPALEISLDGFYFFDKSLQEKIDMKTIDKYDVFILDQITSMNPILREFIALFFRTYYPNKVVLHIFDSSSFLGHNDRIVEGLEIRPSFFLSKDIDKLPDFTSGLVYLAVRVRSGKHEFLTTQSLVTDAYEFRNVNGTDFMRKFSLEYLASFKKDNRFGSPQFICSNQKLGTFTKIIREQLGYTKNLPSAGESLIAYNTFKTNNATDNITVTKGTVMKFLSFISHNIIKVEINDKEYCVMIDLNVFANVLDEQRGANKYKLDPTKAHVFFMYAVTSSMFDHISFNSAIVYIDGMISGAYLYSLLKMVRKNIVVLVDSLVVNSELI